MIQTLHCDWLPKQVIWCYLACSGPSAVFLRKMLIDLDSASVYKHAEKECNSCQHPAIFSLCLANNSYLQKKKIIFFPLRGSLKNNIILCTTFLMVCYPNPHFCFLFFFFGLAEIELLIFDLNQLTPGQLFAEMGQ